MAKKRYLTNDQMRDLVRAYRRSKDPRAQREISEQVVYQLSDMLYKYAGQYCARYSHIDMDGALQAARCSVLDALRCWNEGKAPAGFGFSSYVVYWIKRAISDYGRMECGNTVHVPRGVRGVHTTRLGDHDEDADAMLDHKLFERGVFQDTCHEELSTALEVQRVLALAAETLPPRTVEMMVREAAGESQPDIGRSLGISRQAVGAALQKGKRRLAEVADAA